MPPEPNVNMEKSEETEQIRREMHRAINERDLDRVQKCLDEAKYLRLWLNPDNGESALCSAVRQDAFEICGLLASYNCTHSEENKNKELNELRSVNRIMEAEYRYQLFLFARKFPYSSYLIPRSDSIGSCGETKLPELYQRLNKIPYVQTILQVVATSPHIQMMFDFNNDDLNCMLWYEANSETYGKTLLQRHEIHIGAKREENELLGTLAHELCHYALNIVYENGAKPYKRRDKSTKKDYVAILEEIQDKQQLLHDVIKRAFITNRVREEELIVRVPHLLAMHCEQILQEQVPKLLEFFKDNVIRDMNEFLEKSIGYKDREAIKEQNVRFGKAKEMEKLGITFKTKYDLSGKALLVLTAPNMTFLEVMVNDAVRSKGESYVFLGTKQWDTELKYVLLDNKCYNVILSSDPEFDLTDDNRKAMLDILVELCRVRVTRVILLTKDRDQDDFVKDMRKQHYFVDNAEDAHVANAEFDNVTDECKETVLRASRIHFQQKRNVKVTEADMKIFCNALDEDTFLQLCCKRETQVKDEQPSRYENDVSFFVERKCARVIQVDLKEALRDERNEAFAILGCSLENFADLNSSACDVCHFNSVQRFVRCVLLDNADHYDKLKESRFYKDKAIHLVEYKGKSAGYHWIRSNGPLSHLPRVDGGTGEILNEKDLPDTTTGKVVAIYGTAGMGKSLLSLRMAQDLNEEEMNWVIHINVLRKARLLNLNDSLNDSHDAIRQLAKLCDVKEGTFEFRLLVESILNARPFKIFVIFDGLDEVDATCRQFLTKLHNELCATQISKLFLFSRTFCQSEIENTFHTIPFELIAFNKEQQLEFLKTYWKRNDLGIDDAKLDSFARAVLNRFCASGKVSITENPLLVRMIAEIEEEQLHEGKTVLIGAKYSFLDVYEKFVAKKFQIYREKQVGKTGSNETGVAAQYDVTHIEHRFNKSYGLLALKAILRHELIVKLFEKKTLHKLEKGRGLMKDVQEGRLKHGLVEEHSGDTPVFVHQTFAEFFAAHFLANKITSAADTSDQVYDVVAHMYGSEEYAGVLDFFDAMGTKSHALHRYIMNNDSENAKNAIKEWRSLDGFRRTPLHVAALQADQETLNIISGELDDKMAKELREKDMLGMTPLMYIDGIRAWKRLDVLCTGCTDRSIKWMKMLPAVNETITKERRFKNSVFSDTVITESKDLLQCFFKACGTRKDIEQHIGGECQATEKPMMPVHFNLNAMPKNISNPLLPYADIRVVSGSGLTFFHMSAVLGRVDICRYLLCLLPVDARDRDGATALHASVIYGHPDVLHILLPHSASGDGTDKNNSTALHAVPKLHGLFELRTLYLSAVVHTHDRRWCTSSHDTALERHDVVLSFILPHLDGTIRNYSGESALHESAFNLFWRSIVLLLPYSDVDAVNDTHETPMLRSVSDNSLLRNLRETSSLQESVDSCMVTEDQSIASVKLLILHSDVNVAVKKGHTALRRSALHKHMDAVRLLLPLSLVNIEGEGGETLMHYIAKSGNIKVAKFLLRFSFVIAQNDKGKTALHLGASCGHMDVVRFLLPLTRIDRRDAEGCMPLHDCAREGHLDVVEFLLPHSWASQCDKKGNTPLHKSATNDHVDVVRAVLPHSDAFICGEYGHTALHVSVCTRCSHVVKALLPYSEVDGRNNLGMTALLGHVSFGIFLYSLRNAVESNEPTKISGIRTLMLLVMHSDVNAADALGRTALHLSLGEGQWYPTQLLLPLSSISAVDEVGRTLLHHAVKSRKIDVVRHVLLLSPVNATSRDGKTPLHTSSKSGIKDIVSLLLPLTRIDLPNARGRIPLHDCAQRGHLDVVEFLLPHSWPNQRDKEGNTPLHKSTSNNHVDVVRAIIPHSNAFICDTDGSTALHLSALTRCSDVVKMLLPYSEVDGTNNAGETPLQLCVSDDETLRDPRSLRSLWRIRKDTEEDTIRTLKFLILRSDVNIADKNGGTALHRSVSAGQGDVVKLLLPVSWFPPLVSIIVRDEYDTVQLTTCARKGNTHIAHLLIPHSSTTKTGLVGCNSLHASAVFGHVDIVRLILPHTDSLIRDYDGDTALHNVRGSVGVKLLLPYSDVEVTNNSGRTALLEYLFVCIKMWEAQEESDDSETTATDDSETTATDDSEKSLVPGADDIRMIKILLLHSAVDMTAEDDGTTLQLSGCHMPSDSVHDVVSSNREDASGEIFLQYAVLRGKLDVARFLLPDSPLHTHDDDGELLKELRPFFYAVYTLRSVGRLTWISDACKYVPLHYCVTKGNARMTELVLPHSSTSGNNRSGCTALQLSSYNGREQIVRVILPHTDVMFRTYNGETAFHVGAYRHCYDVVTLLLPYSDVNVADKFGNAIFVRSLRGYSLWFEHGVKNTTETWEKCKMMGKEDMRLLSMRMFKLLVLHSDLDIVDEDDRTALHVSVSLGLLDATKLLLPHFDSPFPRLQPRGDEVAQLLSP